MVQNAIARKVARPLAALPIEDSPNKSNSSRSPTPYKREAVPKKARGRGRGRGMGPVVKRKKDNEAREKSSSTVQAAATAHGYSDDVLRELPDEILKVNKALFAKNKKK